MNDELQKALSRIAGEKDKAALRTALLDQASNEMYRFDTIGTELIKKLNQDELMRRAGVQLIFTQESSNPKPRPKNAFSTRGNVNVSHKWGNALRIEGQAKIGSKEAAFFMPMPGWSGHTPELRVNFYIGYPDVAGIIRSYEIYELREASQSASDYLNGANPYAPNRGKLHKSLVYEPVLEAHPLCWREQGQLQQKPVTLAEVIQKTAGQLLAGLA